jgi:hypothetical protein
MSDNDNNDNNDNKGLPPCLQVGQDAHVVIVYASHLSRCTSRRQEELPRIRAMARKALCFQWVMKRFGLAQRLLFSAQVNDDRRPSDCRTHSWL